MYCVWSVQLHINVWADWAVAPCAAWCKDRPFGSNHKFATAYRQDRFKHMYVFKDIRAIFWPKYLPLQAPDRVRVNKDESTTY